MERYSFSKLQSFCNCPYGYYLTYIEKRKGIENVFAQYGVMNHKILEEYAKGKLEVYELLGEYKKRFDKEVTMEFPYNKWCDLKESYYNDGISFYKNFEGFDKYNILGSEIKFSEKLNDYYFNGYIDLLLEEKNGDLILTDFKSKSGFKNKDEQREYSRQLFLYSIYIYNKYGKYPKKLVFNMFRKQKNIEIDFNINGLNEAISWMNNTIKRIKECKNFYFTYDEFFCNNLCNHRETCIHNKAKEEDINC